MICPKCGIAYNGNFCPNGCNSANAQVNAPVMNVQPPQKKGSAGMTALTIVFLILFYPVGLILMWACAKNWHIAVKIVITVFFGLVTIGAIANMNTDDAGAPSQSQTGEAGGKAQAADPAPKDDPTVLGDYKVEAISARLAKDGDDDVIIIKYRFTNNGKEAKSFTFAISDKVFQNGIECEPDYFTFELEGYENGQSSKDVQPGKTYEPEIAYKLNDTTNDVTVECSELISFSDKKYTKTFTLK